MTETAGKLAPEMLDELLKGVKTEQDLSGVLKQLSKQLIEHALEAEMTEHLGHDKGGVVINPRVISAMGLARRKSKAS